MTHLTEREALQLIAAGWEVIESDGRRMTIQAPEDWDEDGDREHIIDTHPPVKEAGKPFAYRRRPKGSDRGWTLFPNDDPAEVLFYQTNGRYDVEPLYLAPHAPSNLHILQIAPSDPVSGEGVKAWVKPEGVTWSAGMETEGDRVGEFVAHITFVDADQCRAFVDAMVGRVTPPSPLPAAIHQPSYDAGYAQGAFDTAQMGDKVADPLPAAAVEGAKLAACPMCGDQEPSFVGHPDAPKGKVFVGCETCGTRGMACEKREHAARFWNRRAAPPADTVRAAPDNGSDQ